MELVNWVVFTKECAECGFVFSRFAENTQSGLGQGDRREQNVCPICMKPVFIVKNEHPGEEL